MALNILVESNRIVFVKYINEFLEKTETVPFCSISEKSS